MLKSLQDYLNRIRTLRRHPGAPYKPFLLLSVIELIEQGDIRENWIPLSHSLIDTFHRYTALTPHWNSKIHNPFFHLKTDGFWHLHPKTLNKRSPSSTPTLRQLLDAGACASFDDRLFLFLTDAQHRETIRQTIIDTYFPHLRQTLEAHIAETQQIGAHRQLLIQHVEEHPFSYQITETPIVQENPIRSAAFRREIMRMYNYTCAICQLRILTAGGESVTEAAHIIPFSVSQNDDVRNGISLCKLHHWAFDKGLISVSENYRVMIARLLESEGPVESMLSTFRNSAVLLPEHDQLYPSQHALDWHRENIMQHTS